MEKTITLSVKELKKILEERDKMYRAVCGAMVKVADDLDSDLALNEVEEYVTKEYNKPALVKYREYHLYNISNLEMALDSLRDKFWAEHLIDIESL